MKEMHDAGAATIAQDEASCVVYGMPREAVLLGGAEEVLSLPIYPEMTDAQQDEVVAAVRELFKAE